MAVPQFVAIIDKTKMSDTLTEDGARRIAKTIENAWRKCGNTKVKAWAEEIQIQLPPPKSPKPRTSNELPAKTHMRAWFWVVKSNLVGGLPPT